MRTLGSKTRHSLLETVLTKEILTQRYLVDKVSTITIGHEFGVNPFSVNNWLRRYNIPLRNRSEFTRKYLEIDTKGFSDPVTDWDAYWLGFLAADGSINQIKGRWEVRIHLAIADYAHLETFVKGMGVNNPVFIYSNGESCKVTLTSQTLVKALAKWNIVPNKTDNMLWPHDLPEHLKSAYIRGYFDGDGTIYWRNRVNSKGTSHWAEATCRFISGGESFLEAIEKELITNGIQTNKTYRNQKSNAFVLPVSTKKTNLKMFASYIYNNSTVCLERKRAAFSLHGAQL